jgi:hypothetical protein
MTIIRIMLAAGLAVATGGYSQAVILDDPLDGGTLGTAYGGAFGSGGWSKVSASDRIVWTLDEPVHNGSFEFDIAHMQLTGLAANKIVFLSGYTAGGENYHIRCGTNYAQFKIKTHINGEINEETVWTPLDGGVSNDETYHWRIEWKDGKLHYTINGEGEHVSTPSVGSRDRFEDFYKFTVGCADEEVFREVLPGWVFSHVVIADAGAAVCVIAPIPRPSCSIAAQPALTVDLLGRVFPWEPDGSQGSHVELAWDKGGDNVALVLHSHEQ